MSIRHAWFAVLTAGAAALAPTATLLAQAETPEAAATESIDALIEQLADDSYKVRKAATKRLQEIGERALEDLEIAAQDHDDAEVRLRANRIVKRIEASGEKTGTIGRLLPSRTNRAPRAMDRDAIRSLFDEMFDQRFPGHQRMLDRVLQDGDAWLDSGIGIGGAPDVDASSSVSIQIDDEHVRVEIETEEDGESKSEVYEAKDLDEFRELYPEVAEKYLGRSGRFSLRLDPNLRHWIQPDPGLTMPNLRNRIRAFQPVFPQLRAERRRGSGPGRGAPLGVHIEPLHPAVAEFLGFEPGQGLRVRAVGKGSLAEALGVESGDVILEIAGAHIGTRRDVAERLGKIPAGETVEVTVNRRGRPLELSAEKRHSATDEENDQQEEEAELQRTK